MTDLSEEAIRFLSHAARGGILSFMPHGDPLIADLLDRGYLASQADADPEYELLLITQTGRLAVLSVQGEPEDRLPPVPWE